MLLYSRVSKEVAPKKKKVMELQLQLDETNRNLAIKEAELQKEKDNVDKLKKDSDVMVAKKEELSNNIELTKARLDRSEKLTLLLAEEGKRWVQSIKTLEVDLENVVGDVFLSAGCMSYNGPFTGQFRQELLTKWIDQMNEHHIPISENFSLSK